MSESTTETILKHRSKVARRPLNVFAHYLFALTLVSVCYFVYLNVAVPWIEGQPGDPQTAQLIVPTTDIVAPPIDKNRLIPFLPKDAWELGPSQTLTTSTGTILFQKFEQLDNGTLQVSPFTLISGLGEDELVPPTLGRNNKARSSKPRTPIVIRCVKGANLKFDQPIEKAFEGKAKLQIARLTGDVDIYRPPTQPDNADMLHVLTRNVQVDLNRIYTLEPVAFSFGPHRGRGRNLLIDLKHAVDVTSPKRDFSSIDGVTRLELAFLDYLRIEPTKSNQLVPTDPRKNNKPSFFDGNSPLEVTCSGAFAYDFASTTLSLQDNVVAKQMDQHQNSIVCDRLELTMLESNAQSMGATAVRMEPNGSAVQPMEQQADGHSSKNLDPLGKMSKLKLKRFVAIGSPAVVTSNSHPAKFSADELVFDAETNQLTGRCSDSRDVTVITPKHQIVTRQLRYTVTEDDSLGPFAASGAGRLLTFNGPGKDKLFVSWERGLSTKADPRFAHRQQITIDGSAKISAAGKLELQSENLVLDLDQRKNESGDWEYHPVRAVANSTVSVKTPKIEGTTDRLTVNWITDDARQTQLPHRVGRIQYTQELQSPSQRTPSQFVEVGTESQFKTAQPRQALRSEGIQRISYAQEISVPPRKANVSRKLVFRGRETTLGLMQNHDSQGNLGKSNLDPQGELSQSLVGDSFEMTEVIVKGDVNVTQQEWEGDRKVGESLTMSGDHLQVVPQTLPIDARIPSEEKREFFHAVISSSVEPARVLTKDFLIEGAKINLDQIANKIWVQGLGRIQFAAPEKKESEVKLSQFGANADRQRDLKKKMDIRWQGGMIFDGDSIYFEHRVELEFDRTRLVRSKSPSRSEVETERLVTRATGEALKVELSQRIDLQSIEGQQQVLDGIEVRELVFVDWLPDTDRAFEKRDLQTSGPNSNRSLKLAIKNFAYDANGNQKQQQVISARQATVDVARELVLADGPGSVITHQLNDVKEEKDRNDRSAVNRQSRNPLSKFSGNKQRGPIAFIQVNFDGRMKIDGAADTVDVSQRIRTCYSDVQSWDQTIDPDLVTQGTLGNSVLLNCEKMSLAQWQPRDADEAINELIATGNVRINSNELDATADRVSYSEASDMLVVEGTPRTDARILLRRTNTSEMIVQKLRYRLSDQYYEVLAKSITTGN